MRLNKTAQPNILWISAEDISPMLGCYGDSYAVTPTLDALAAQGIRYDMAFAHAAVCAPARSGTITGMYPSSIGSHHMRSMATLPEHIRCFPEYLREAGYYCANNNKEDYNFRTSELVWDDSSSSAHWRHRAPGQPFFCAMNLAICHESVNHRDAAALQRDFRRLTPQQFHDSAEAPLPAYMPDIPEFREEWARYYDAVTATDYQVDDILKELQADGLADDTVVMFWGDHGTGMPRGKRWIYESGMRIPLIIRFPEKYQHLAPAAPGSADQRLVSFIDFAPTVLSLAGVPIPEHMQGTAFLGPEAETSRQYVYGIRDRMDNRYDFIRCIRDARYRYIRNFNPQVPYNQYIDYLYKAKGMQAWARLAEAGTLEGAPALYMQPRKPVEELYDLVNDPDEVNNLANTPAVHDIQTQMREDLYAWMRETRDLGLLDECEIAERAGDRPEFELGQDQQEYDLPRILETADLHCQGQEAVPELRTRLQDSDSGVRYWAAIGLSILEARDSDSLRALEQRLEDASAGVRFAAADALCRADRYEHAMPVLIVGLDSPSPSAQLRAANILDKHAGHARPAMAAIVRIVNDHTQSDYLRAVLNHLLNSLPVEP